MSYLLTKITMKLKTRQTDEINVVLDYLCALIGVRRFFYRISEIAQGKG